MSSSSSLEGVVDHDHRLTFGLMESSPTLQWIPPFERTFHFTIFVLNSKRNVATSIVSIFENLRDFKSTYDLKGLIVHDMC